MDAQYFQLDNWDELAAKYSDDEIWKINEKFLDIQTSSGREIYLSHNPAEYIDKGEFYSRELQYLRDNGYRFIDEGGIYDMRLDSAFYNNMIGVFDLYMNKIFGTDIRKTETVCKFENRGFFRLGYEYFPNHYKIEVENEFRTFDITIFDDEQASNSLFRISKFNDQLGEENIKNSILLLKAVLLRNDFNMYFRKDGKLYRKNSEGIKRIKHIEELFNG